MKYKGIDYYKEKSKDEKQKSSDRPIAMSQSDYDKMVNAMKKYKTPNLDGLIKELFSINEKEVLERHKQIDADIEYILRNKIDKPIKGEITKGKLRWRGIKDIAYGENFEFLGIMQRGKLIKR
ncbi:hypothetical protein JGH11_19210 [Dysgonomonas sp. Marseille-P4677]|uniref:hypothetical protein n=1 Tax=Dysgonomonas sp. Marseille-P4677 TaxID=2364790 RepID=UPI00191273D2|nr:hypothetical protein [Dysgonomonas sp. Marseille-P4677]MBK5723001.1 hypothetical protein [Dysgonomonas sp. Marseille-P4677]